MNKFTLSEIDRVNRILQGQHMRQAAESWNYLNINDPQYPELIVMREKLQSQEQNPSVEEVRKILKGNL